MFDESTASQAITNGATAENSSGLPGQEQPGGQPQAESQVQSQQQAQSANTLLGGAQEQAEGEQPKAPAQATADPAPIEYADFSIPEEFQVNSALMGEFKVMAAEMQLPQEAAQKLIDLQVKNAQAGMDAWQAQRAAWRSEFPKGSDEPVVQDAVYVLRRFDTDGGLARELAATGQGDNPMIIRFLANIRKEFKEDTIHTGSEGAHENKRPLRDRLWPDDIMPR